MADEKEDRSHYGERGTPWQWNHLSEETRERYKAIEERVREKVRKGLL